MKFNVVTIFPDMITAYTRKSVLQRGQDAGAISVQTVNPREFTPDARGTIDDTPYGGGAGMVMKPEPIYAALKSIDAIPFAKESGLGKLKKIATGKVTRKKRTILMSPRGRQFDQRLAEQWAGLDELTFVCGRYEGVDQRVVDHMVDEEVSIGPYVLAGGELGALVILEAVARLVPGVLGNPASLEEETFGMKNADFRMQNESEIRNLKSEMQNEYPQYTKPYNFKGWTVPDVLLSGNHKRVEEWRKEQAGEHETRNL